MLSHSQHLFTSKNYFHQPFKIQNLYEVKDCSPKDLDKDVTEPMA
jgi:hypothetical protein